MDIRIEKLNAHDIDRFEEVIRVFEEVFEMKNFEMPPRNYLRHLLMSADFFAIVARAGNRVVGSLTSYIMHQYYEQKPLVYIYDLAVKANFQRQGIGRKLIEGNN